MVNDVIYYVQTRLKREMFSSRLKRQMFQPGNSMLLKNIPDGSMIHNIEMKTWKKVVKLQGRRVSIASLLVRRATTFK